MTDQQIRDVEAKIVTVRQQIIDTKHQAEKEIAFLTGKIEAFKELLPTKLEDWTSTEGGESAPPSGTSEGE